MAPSELPDVEPTQIIDWSPGSSEFPAYGDAPAFTAGWQIAPAIATGNGVVIKPSEFTPVTTVALAMLAEKAGLPAGLVNVLCGLGQTAGQAAIAHEAVRKVIFVGSPMTGRLVAIAAAQALKPAVLELGVPTTHSCPRRWRPGPFP